MIHPRPNVFCLFLILLISCSDVAVSIVADETNSESDSFCCRNHIDLCVVSGGMELLLSTV